MTPQIEMGLPWKLSKLGYPLDAKGNSIEILLEDRKDLWASVVAAVNSHAELVAALHTIALLRKPGATPKLVSGEIVEEIEKLALAALAKAEGHT